MFCSTSVTAHLLRGLCAFALLGLAIYSSLDAGAAALIIALPAFAAAFILLRGCPMCWLVGLCETIAVRKSRKE